MWFLSAFLVCTAYLPGVMSPSTSVKWFALSGVAALLVCTTQPRMDRGAVIGAAFLVWVSVSTLWSLSMADSIQRAWHFIAVGMVVLAASGASEAQFRSAVSGIGYGVAANLVATALGVPGATPVAGLMMNGNYLAEIAVIGAVLCFLTRQYTLFVVCVVAAVLPMSRGAILVLAVMALCCRPRLALAALVVGACAAGAYAYTHGIPVTRVALVLNGLAGVTFFGHGSFWAGYPAYHDAVVSSPDTLYRFAVRPRTAHNDIVTLLFEHGVVGAALLACFIARIWRVRLELYGLVAFAILGLFNFPLYSPASVFAFAICAGRLCSGGSPVPVFGLSRRNPLHARRVTDGSGEIPRSAV